MKKILNHYFKQLQKQNKAIVNDRWLGSCCTFREQNGRIERLYIEEGVELFLYQNCSFERSKIPVLEKVVEITALTDGYICVKKNGFPFSQYDKNSLLFFNEIEEQLYYNQVTGISVFLNLEWLEHYLIQENQFESWQEISRFFEHSQKIIFSKDSEAIHRSIARYLQLDFKQNAMNHLLIKAKVLEFLSHSLQKVWPETINQRIQGVLDIIDQQFYLPLQVRQLAEVANISESSMQHYFKASFGMTTYQYIQQKRVAYAADLLIQTTEPITEISLKVGYDNPSKFAKIFKRLYGETPLHFRKKYRDSDTPINFH